MAQLSDYYENLMEERGYDSVNEMCNDLGLNYDDVTDDDEDDD